eukprot:350147-Rhodomonas_salina.1
MTRTTEHCYMTCIPVTVVHCQGSAVQVLTLRQAKTLAVDPMGGGVCEFESYPSKKSSHISQPERGVA